MKSTEILNSLQVSLTIRRLCFQLIENHHNFSNTVLVGLQPNGVFLVNRLKKELEAISGNKVQTGALDITFFRDDFRRKNKPLVPSVTNINFSIENKVVVLVDDVFFTGRTVRSGLDAIMTFGRPLSGVPYIS
jgi:pyrimidine operon attenuation protein/uracil phosphoribosyltransferase